MKILICKVCNKEFYPVTYFDGKRLWRRGRKYCFECVPYKPSKVGDSFTKSRNTPDGKRKCRICKEYKFLNQFSPTNKIGNLNSYCKPCAAKKKRKPTQRFKEECVTYKGGECIICGYKKCIAALEFHHRNPEEKDFSMRDIHTVTLTEEIKKELDKCDLLCSNCHKEIHYITEWEKGENYMTEEKKELNITENISKATEVAFSFDSTGSMSPCLANVRQHMEKTVEEMFELIPNLKVGFVAHGDYCDVDNCYTVLPLTDDKVKIYNFIRNAPATGGGDSPECYELALNLAKSLGWSDNQGGKILVMIGDESPHEPDYPGNVDKLDWRKELADLKVMGIDVYPLQCLYNNYSEERNSFWANIAESHGTPLLKLQDMGQTAVALTGYAAASAGSHAFAAYETKNAEIGLCSMGGAEYLARNTVLKKAAEKYDTDSGT